MKELIKEFKHIARDVTIYLLPGLTFLVLCVCFYAYYNNEWKYTMLFDIWIIIFILFVAYIIGHLLMGFMEFLFVIVPLEKRIRNLIFRRKIEDIEKLESEFKYEELDILAFEKKEKYEFFVERHTQLSLFRWNLSGVFLITSIISFIAIFKTGLPWYFSLIQFSLFICLLLFSIISVH